MDIDYTYELEQLDKGNRSSKLILSIINKNKARAEQIKKFYERYRASVNGVPILTRNVEDPMAINNRINNDFFSEIIDIRTGYFAGNEISYIVNPEAETEWKEFRERNRLADIDSETTKHAGIAGFSTRLLYIDKETAKERIAILPAWQTILLGENGIDEARYGIRFYEMQIEESKVIARVELYEAGKWTEYQGDSLETIKQIEEHDHVFDLCPMWGYMNNDELQGEAEKVIEEIDAYDRVISDINSEVEAFRSAYLAFFGVAAPNPEEEEESTANPGTFYFEEGQDGKFITKTMQTDAIEAHLDRLHENIYLFTKTPNFRDKKYGSVPSGIALKHMMQPLENKTISFERKFTSANIRMFEILETAWSKKRVTLKPYEVIQKYTRNFPKDMLYEAQVQTELKGNVPELVRLSLFPGIQDPVEALAELEAEQQSIMDKMNAEQEKIDTKLGEE